MEIEQHILDSDKPKPEKLVKKETDHPRNLYLPLKESIFSKNQFIRRHLKPAFSSRKKKISEGKKYLLPIRMDSFHEKPSQINDKEH